MDQCLLGSRQRLRIGGSELGVSERKIRAYLVAPSVVRLRYRDRGLRLMLRSIPVSAPEQRLG